MIKQIDIKTTKRYELIDITDKVEQAVEKDGLICVFVPHSTCGLLMTENESGLKHDWLGFFKKLVSGIDFKHNQIDDNADSHILSGLVGQEKTLIVDKGRIVRGTWQQIILAEFDGPRNRKVIIKI